MLRKETFAHKLLTRLDRIDQKAVSEFVQSLIRENKILEDALQALDEGIVILNPDQSLFFMNHKASEWLGLPTADQERIKILDVLPDKEFQKWLKGRLPLKEDLLIDQFHLIVPREMTVRAALARVHKNQEDEKWLLSLTPHPNAVSETDRSARLSSLLKLAGGIAHEIGNPLNSIGIHLGLLNKQMENLSALQKKNLEKPLNVIRSETARLDKIIRNFLKATRNPPLRFKLENMNDVLQESLDFLKPELEQHKIRVRFQPDPKLPSLLMDKEKMQQVFLNLLKNSMEAMPRGGNLGIRIFHKTKVLWLEFRDEGAGIKETDLPFIFDAYFTTKEGGSGLGLMTVYNIIRDHGGRIQVASAPGKGTTFTLILPMRQPKLQLPEPEKL